MHWCVLSLGVVAFGAFVLRWLVRKITPNETVIAHADEFVGQMCSGVFIMELGVIASMYGNYSAALLLVGFIHVFLKFTYFKHSRGLVRPLTFIVLYYQEGRIKRFSLFFAASMIVTQIVALICGQKF